MLTSVPLYIAVQFLAHNGFNKNTTTEVVYSH